MIARTCHLNCHHAVGAFFRYIQLAARNMFIFNYDGDIQLDLFVPSWFHSPLPCRILPESIPWLCANNRTPEAERILKKAFKMNGKPAPDNILLPPESADTIAAPEKPEQNGRSLVQGLLTMLKPRKKSAPSETETSEKVARYTLLDVLRHPRLCLYAVVMCLLW